MPGIALLLNPRAKRHQRDPALATRLTRQLHDQGLVFRAKSLQELTQVAEELRRREVDVVAVAGGDGTNHLTISELVQVYGDARLPYFALLRGGTMNTTANSFGISRRKPETLLARYLSMYSRHGFEPMRFVESHVLQVHDRCGFIFGTGAIHGFIAEYNRRPERSAAWAAKVLSTAIASAAVGGEVIQRVAARWCGHVSFEDGSAFPDRDYLTVGASTCGQIGLGFRPFYRSTELPGYLHFLGIHCSPSSFIQGLGKIRQGKALGGNRTYEKLAKEAHLIARDGVVRYTLDGDVYAHEGPLRVACGPRIRILSV